MEIPSQQFADNVFATAGSWMLLRCDIGMRRTNAESAPCCIVRVQYIFWFDTDEWMQRQGSNSYYERLQIRWHQVSDRVHVQRRNQCRTCKWNANVEAWFIHNTRVSHGCCFFVFLVRFFFFFAQEQLASLLRTAEDLRIKGLAEVSWHDENTDTKHKHSNKSNSARVGGNGSASQSASSGHPTTVRLPSKRNSISSNNSNQNHISSDEADHLAEITSRNDKDDMHPIRLSAAAAVAPLLMPTDSSNAKQTDTCITADDQQMPPVKKKRGRPPLDDDFDSYSTPRISHVEGASNSNNYRRISQPTYDDNSGDLHHHQHLHNSDPLSQPTSILEQSMEVQMDCDEDGVENIIPKVERPDTPASVKNYNYDDNDFNPSSPKETDNDGYDAGLSSQVYIDRCPSARRIDARTVQPSDRTDFRVFDFISILRLRWRHRRKPNGVTLSKWMTIWPKVGVHNFGKKHSQNVSWKRSKQKTWKWKRLHNCWASHTEHSMVAIAKHTVVWSIRIGKWTSNEYTHIQPHKKEHRK